MHQRWLIWVSCLGALLCGKVLADGCGGPVRRVSKTVALQVCSERAVRVVRAASGEELERAMTRKSLVVLEGSGHEAEPTSEEGSVVLATKYITVRNNSGNLEFYDHSGRRVVGELNNVGGYSFLEKDVVQQSWSIEDGQGLFGGGGQINGLSDFAFGGPLLLVQNNLEAAVPFFVNSAGYGILWDNYAETMLNPPELSLKLDRDGKATFTATTDGTHWFHLHLCDAAFNYGCDVGSSPVQLFLSDLSARSQLTPDEGNLLTKGSLHEESRRLVCEKSAINMVNAFACRTESLSKGRVYQVELIAVNREKMGSYVGVSAAGTYKRTSISSKNSHFVDYYFVIGDDKAADSSATMLDTVIGEYRHLTGPARLFGRWAYGFWQCREKYNSQKEILEAARLMREHRIPVDNMVQDWHYWGSLGWGPQWDPAIYPDPKGMVAELNAMNFHLMVSVWNKFDETTRFYKAMVAEKLNIDGTNWLDPWNPVALERFFEWCDQADFSIGVDSIWLDATEPEGNIQRGKNVSAGLGDELLNTYSLMVAKGLYEGLQKRDNRRVFSLTRSSFAGQQRYGAVVWSGDIEGTWDTLRRQISLSVNYQLSGIPYWAMDTGGFFRPADQYNSTDYHDLLTRWFQFAVFTPIFRVHGCDTHTELWNFGSNVQERIVSSAIHLRYRLLDYIYTGFHRVEDYYTMQRGLVLDFAFDPTVFKIADQFMFGPSFMVVPLYTREANRTFYLPEPFSTTGQGSWRDFYSGESLRPGWHVASDPGVQRIPVYVRPSIVVLSPVVQYAMQPTEEGELHVRIYSGRDSEFTLYEDDGLDASPHRRASYVRFAWNEQSKVLTVNERKGELAEGVPWHRKISVVLVRPGRGVGVSGDTPDTVFLYEGVERAVKLDIPSISSTRGLSEQ